jgi:hypothetical protein
MRNLAAASILLACATIGQSATIPVTTTSDSVAGSVRQAIQSAAAGDTIVFQIPTTDPGYDPATGYFTITLTGQTAATKTLVINKSLTIDGSDQKIVIRRGNTAPTDFCVFSITGASTAVVLSHIWVSNGNVTASASAGGGGIQNHANLTVRDCTFTGNAGSADGGAIFNFGPLTVSRSTFSGNSAYYGGAIYSAFPATIDTCTFTANSAAVGGAIFNIGNSAATVMVLQSCTLYGNSATAPPIGAGSTNYGGGLVTRQASARIQNTIIANNTSPTAPDVSGTVISDGYNLIGSADGNSGFTSTGDQVGVTAAQVNLDPLGAYGGPTSTMRPRPGSLAIDKGKRSTDSNGQPISIDQRGFPRPVDRPESNAPGGDGSDIGAVELGAPQPGPTFTVNTTAEHDDGECTTDDCTLIEALNLANAVADANIINFAPGLTGAIGTANLTSLGLTISNPVTINGPGARVLTITGRTSARVFRVLSSNVNISGLSIVNGKVTNDQGGAISNTGGLTLTDCTITNSVATGSTTTTGNGGGVYNAAGASLTLTRCTVSGSSAGRVGGGISNEGILVATNCTFSGDSAIQGGGIYSAFSNNASKVSLRNCTITLCAASDAGTAAGDGGGGFYGVGNSGQYNLGNTIIAGNTATTNPDLRGNFHSDGHNFIGNVGSASGLVNNVSGDQVGTSGSPKNAQLDALKNNGGPTDTHALLSISTAINAGDDALAPPTDQRGYYRSGVSDIGAFEFGGIVPVTPSVTTSAATNVGTASATLNASVNPNGLATMFNFTSDFQSFAAQAAGSGTASVPFTVNVTGLSPNTQYHFNATATNGAGTTQGVEQIFTTLPAATPTPTPGLVANVSTRLPVGTGDNVLIEGFSVQGPAGSTKKIIVRAIGPFLATCCGITDALANPTLEIHDPSNGNAIVAMNDDWKVTQFGSLITADQSGEIAASGFAPSNDLESAIIANLPPGSYTAVVRGVGNSVGTGVVDAFDLSPAASAKLVNIATRGLIQPGDQLMIAGFVVQGAPVKAVVKAIGPSLAAFGINNALADTTLQLRDQNGVIVVENDNWKVRSDGSSQQAEMEATGLQPTNDLEAAFVTTIQPGQYTAQVRGKPEGTGIGVVQVYFLQ